MLEKVEGNKLEDSGLEEHMAHWAEVLDRWVKGIDSRLGRQDGGSGGAPLDEAERWPKRRPVIRRGSRLEGWGLTNVSDGTKG